MCASNRAQEDYRVRVISKPEQTAIGCSSMKSANVVLPETIEMETLRPSMTRPPPPPQPVRTCPECGSPLQIITIGPDLRTGFGGRKVKRTARRLECVTDPTHKITRPPAP